jgi:nucleoid-associated protein YgaU
MRRRALCTLAGLAVILPACKSNQKKADQAATTDPYYTGTDATASAAPVYSQPAAIDRSYEGTGGMTSGPRYHTVARHETLFSLARTYYGNASKWRDIYEANRSQISDPNKIKVGQKLVIP